MSRLLAKGGTQLRWGTAVFRALSWGAGAALGVATGAWLTVVGEAGAPGIESLDVTSDIVILPLVALAVVTLAHLGLQVAVALVRGTRRSGHAR